MMKLINSLIILLVSISIAVPRAAAQASAGDESAMIAFSATMVPDSLTPKLSKWQPGV